MSKHLSYMSKLDGLRAIAALMVILAHYLENLNSSLSFKYGGNGVQIFFTISGFLITFILLSQKNKNFELSKTKMISSFMMKRALRLFPIYYIFISALFLISKFGGLWICPKGDEWYYFTYTQNYLFYKINFQSPLLNHSWSLAVEEQFYLLWPFLIFFTPKKHELKLLVSVFFIGFVSKFYFYYYFTGIGTTKGVTFIHFDTLGIGALLAFIIHYKHENIINFLEKYSEILFSILFVLTTVFTYYAINEYLLALFLCFMSVFLVFMASSSKVYFIDSILNLSILNFLGKISYGIYLYHKPVPFFVDTFLAKTHIVSIENKLLLFIIYVSITLLITIISWLTIEKYFLKLKDKIDI